MKRKITITLLCLLAVIITSQAQSIKKEKRKLLNQARVSFEQEDYLESWSLYRKVLQLDSSHETAGLNAAISAEKMNYPSDSIVFLSNNLFASSDADAKFYLAQVRHRQKRFDEAISLLDTYAKVKVGNRLHGNNSISTFRKINNNAKELIGKPRPSVIKNMGAAINSPFADYVPVIVPDESALFFTSKRPVPGGVRNGDNNFFEDVYVSYQENGKWKSAVSVGAPVNSETNDGCVAVSPDGEKMIIYRTAANKESGDLLETKMGANNTWQPLQMMTPQINSPHIETSACYSKDTSEIYFSSDRPGGYGGKDIYRIKKLPNGNWSAAYNLGDTINTSFDEDAPFLHPDGVTLYFSSNGNNSMGGYDVFKAVLDVEKNDFSYPENLGYPINDIGDDIFFVLSVDGKRGYYSSVKPETFGDIDIYEIDTRFGANDLAVKIGFVTVDDKPARVRIILSEEGSDQVSGDYYSNSTTGKFILILNPFKTYKGTVEAEDCQPVTFKVQPQAADKSEAALQIALKKNNAH